MNDQKLKAARNIKELVEIRITKLPKPGREPLIW
jgi:hypothetical protein